MAYIRIKTINGKRYKYLVAGKRVFGKVRQKVVSYLGPIDPVYKVKRERKKTNASVFIRKLTDMEEFSLHKAMKSHESFTKDRAKILLFSSKKLFAKQIADNINCEERKVRLAIKDFNKKGLDALQRGKAKGAVPKFNDMKKKIILMHFSKDPRSFDYHFTTWTLPRFKKHLIDYAVVESISIESLRQIIIQAGGKLKRSKRWQYSPDKNFHKKNNK